MKVRSVQSFVFSLVFSALVLYGSQAISHGDHAASQWLSLASLATGRSEISAALLGDKVYVAGGIGFMRTLDSCESYDTKQNVWAPCPALPYPLHHVALASDGANVYAAGGYVSLRFTHDPNAMLWRLDESANKWVEVAALPSPIGEHGLVAHRGRLYLIGGRTQQGDSSALWRYEPASQQWSQLADMPTPRHSFSTVLVEDEMWVMGGRSAALGTRIDITEVYSFSENTWMKGPTLPEGRGGHVSVAHGSQVYVIGGEVFDPASIIDRHDVYDLETQTWSSVEPPPLPRHGMAAVRSKEEIYLIGGGARPELMTVFTASDSVQAFLLSEGENKH